MDHRIRILSTSDVHGMISPYSYADGKIRKQGFAKLKTLIDSLKDENTILIDNGDVIEGSPFTLYHYSHKGNEVCPVSEAMKRIGFDYINLGNHDFNYGRDALFTHIKETGSICLTYNVLYKGEHLGPEYVIRNLCGRKLALFALTTHFVPNWEKPENIIDFTFLDAYECAVDLVKRIKEKEKPDYIICIYHGGFEIDPDTKEPVGEDNSENQAYRMAETLKDIDILITGHQHRVCQGKLFNSVYTQPGFEGELLSCIDIDTSTGKITASLIDNDLEADKDILSLAEKEEAEVQKWLDTPLGHTPMDLKTHDDFLDRFHKSQLITFINKVQLEVSGADLSASALFLRASGFSQDITMRSLVTTYLFPNTLVVKQISGRILKEYLEYNSLFWDCREDEIIISPSYDFPSPQYHNYDMLDGNIEYDIKVSNPLGQKITRLFYKGKPVQDDDSFTLCINNYRASGGGGFEMLKKAPTIKEIQSSVVELLSDYIQKHQNIEFEAIDNIHIFK